MKYIYYQLVIDSLNQILPNIEQYSFIYWFSFFETTNKKIADKIIELLHQSLTIRIKKIINARLIVSDITGKLFPRIIFVRNDITYRLIVLYRCGGLCYDEILFQEI